MDKTLGYKLKSLNKALGEVTHSSVVFTKVTDNPNLPNSVRASYALIVDRTMQADNFKDWALLLIKGNQLLQNDLTNTIKLSEDLFYLGPDDVISFNPENNSIRALYRHGANANAFLLTEKCNSLCVMCSQPPRDLDDIHHFDALFKCLPLIPRSAPELTLTGGEPTLNFEYFIESIRRAKFHLPNTAIHVLSNGRNFENKMLAEQVSQVDHHDLMFGIPLYSDDEQNHDFVVQAKGAFRQTIKGILNLFKYKVPIEIRVVVHKYTWERLPYLAEYVARNLPFVSHVNFMGLEREGYGKLNFDDLWVDPTTYMDKLDEAINTLDMVGVPIRLYNYPQCHLPRTLRHRAVISISDWKNEFRENCEECLLRPDCSGLFKSIASAETVKVYPEYN